MRITSPLMAFVSDDGRTTAVAVWASRRLGSRVYSEPIPLISLLAISLSLRLVFEEGLFGYKFLALSVMLIMLAVVRGRISGSLVAWLALTSLALNPIPGALSINGRPWGVHAAFALPKTCTATVFGCLIFDAVEKRVRWYLIAWLVVARLRVPPVAAVVGRLHPSRPALSLWFWQLILPPTGFAMAVMPLLKTVRTLRPRSRRGCPTRSTEPASDSHARRCGKDNGLTTSACSCGFALTLSPTGPITDETRKSLGSDRTTA
jgi:hypothetical protein